MSILENLVNDEKWQEYLEYKSSKSLTAKELKKLIAYITNKEYMNTAVKILNGEYEFNYPTRVLISKMGKSKKRIVYMYNYDESNILKMITYLLYEYDYLFFPNCYSFRKNTSVKNAIRKLTRTKNIKDMYGYKVDIKDYFNSVDLNILIPKLKEEIKDKDVYNLLNSILINKKVYWQNDIIEVSKGIMAGVPIAAFLANFYLKEMDRYFYDNGVTYARYSDDIIVFAENKSKLDKYVNVINDFLLTYKLSKNEEKEYYIEPNTKWEFLGFSYFNCAIDVADNAKKKIKGKIRRSARAVRRWMLRKNVPCEKAITFMIKKFNKKFFYKDELKELNWSQWFFPVINVTGGLHDIDIYMQQYLRYIVTGCHNKKNYEKVSYEKLKECNYKSLLNEYYKFKSGIGQNT